MPVGFTALLSIVFPSLIHKQVCKTILFEIAGFSGAESGNTSLFWETS